MTNQSPAPQPAYLSRWLYGSAFALLLLLATLFALKSASPSGTSQLPLKEALATPREASAITEVLHKGTQAAVGKEKEIALTFDDGPGPYTEAVLDLLKQEKVTATFFVNGNHLQEEGANANLARQVVEQGHLIASHSWKHDDFRKKDREQIKNDLKNTCEQIQKATGKSVRFFRFPYGGSDSERRSWVAAAGYIMVGWNVDPQDWKKGRTPTEIAEAALANARPGSILLLHDGGRDRSATVQALPQILRGLKEKGFTIVRLDQLLNQPAYTKAGCE